MNYQRIYDLFILSRLKNEKKWLKEASSSLKCSGYGSSSHVCEYIMDKHEVYVEAHHIVPCAFGGADTRDNLVFLDFKDHVHAHSLLARIHGGSMWGALNVLFGKQDRRRIRISKPLIRSREIARIENIAYLKSDDRRAQALRPTVERAKKVTQIRKQVTVLLEGKEPIPLPHHTSATWKWEHALKVAKKVNKGTATAKDLDALKPYVVVMGDSMSIVNSKRYMDNAAIRKEYREVTGLIKKHRPDIKYPVFHGCFSVENGRRLVDEIKAIPEVVELFSRYGKD